MKRWLTLHRTDLSKEIIKAVKSVSDSACKFTIIFYVTQKRLKDEDLPENRPFIEVDWMPYSIQHNDREKVAEAIKTSLRQIGFEYKTVSVEVPQQEIRIYI